DAEELEGLDHVVDVALAKLLEARRFIEVVVAVGKGESALSCGSDLLGGVLLILRDGGGEEGATTAAILLRVEGCELLDAGELVDGFEVRLQRLVAELVDQVSVHAGGKVVTVLLLQGRLGSFGSGL